MLGFHSFFALKSELSQELRPMAALAWPIVIAELGWMSMGIVDTIVVGRLPDSAESIAAVSLGTILFYAAGIVGSALFLGLDTLVSQAQGAGDVEDRRRSLVSAGYLVLPLTAILMWILWGCAPLLQVLGERPEVMRLMVPYLSTLTWSILPLLVYFGLRRYLQAIDVVRPVMFALVSANFLNLVGNLALVYGKFGVPALGVRGSAWATTISRVYMAAFLAVTLWLRERRDFRWPKGPGVARIARLLALGLPAGGQMFLEIGIFAVAAVLIGRIGSAALAAHQIALNAAAFTFMVPLGIGSAGAVRVGQALGRKDLRRAVLSGWTALALGVGFMMCAAIVFLTVPEWLARMYTSDATVIRLSVSLLAVAAAFQIFDGAQVVLSGVLRGAGDTRTPMVCHLLGYWMCGLPMGYWLCFRWGWGAVGVWCGLCFGLILIGLALLVAWRTRVKRWLEPVPRPG